MNQDDDGDEDGTEVASIPPRISWLVAGTFFFFKVCLSIDLEEFDSSPTEITLDRLQSLGSKYLKHHEDLKLNIFLKIKSLSDSKFQY
jgi:hypothetical protein